MGGVLPIRGRQQPRTNSAILPRVRQDGSSLREQVFDGLWTHLRRRRLNHTEAPCLVLASFPMRRNSLLEFFAIGGFIRDDKVQKRPPARGGHQYLKVYLVEQDGARIN